MAWLVLVPALVLAAGVETGPSSAAGTPRTRPAHVFAPYFDAARLRRFAERTGIGTLSMSAIERDNGACAGRIGSNTCSGIDQPPPWAFTHLLEPFTSREPR